jgi:hypothetical protein
MQKILTHQRVTNWLAALAILFAALSVGMGQIFAKTADDGSLTAICTSTGMKYVKSSALSADTQPASSSSGDTTDCSYCTSNHHSIGFIDESPQFNSPDHFQPQLPSAQKIVRINDALRLPPSRAPPAPFC